MKIEKNKEYKKNLKFCKIEYSSEKDSDSVVGKKIENATRAIMQKLQEI